MKKHPAFLALIGAATLILSCYVIPILVASLGSRPLYGDFEWGGKCICGHEIFLFLDEEYAYEHSPRHKSREKLVRLERTENSVVGIVDRKEGSIPVIRITWDGGKHCLTFIAGKQGDQFKTPIELHQVCNPWRTWMPELLPE